MKTSIALLSLLLFASFAFAADVDGTWKGMINVNGSDFPVTFTFKADGAKLTGTLNQGGPDVAIKQGKIEGNNISFVLELDYNGSPVSLNYKGVVSPTEIKLSGDAGGMTFEYVVKKVK
jgi:hypothetical protein